MPQARMLSKKISHDEDVANLSLLATLMYTWCIPYLDVKGRIHGDMWSLKAIVPHINELTPEVIDQCVDEFVSTGLVVAYGEKQKYLQFRGFFSNQKVYEDKEAKSVIPDPTPEQIQRNSCSTPGKVKESKGKESKYQPSAAFKEIIEKVHKEKGVNISMLINKLKKDQRGRKVLYEIPEEVYISVCETILSLTKMPKCDYPYFMKILNLKAHEYNATANVSESIKFKRSEALKDVDPADYIGEIK